MPYHLAIAHHSQDCIIMEASQKCKYFFEKNQKIYNKQFYMVTITRVVWVKTTNIYLGQIKILKIMNIV